MIEKLPINDLIKTGPLFDYNYFTKSGEDDFKLLIEHKIIKPESKIIDFGCGYSRLGPSIWEFLSDEGKY